MRVLVAEDKPAMANLLTRALRREGHSDRGLSGGSVLLQPKMAEKRRTDEQTSTQEPFSGVQSEGGFGGDPGRKAVGGVGRAV